MNRRDFLEHCAGLAAVSPFFALLAQGCKLEEEGPLSGWDVNFSGRVLVLGAGACGLAAGYVLDRYGIDFQVLEASSQIGGRVRRAPDFADFPIDLGAEWIHQHPSVLADLIDDPGRKGSIDVVPFSPDSAYVWNHDKLTRYNWGANYYSEYKFRTSTWFGFLEDHIARPITDRILLDRPAVEVDSSGPNVRVLDALGTTHEADALVVTLPMAVLQNDGLAFTPPLPSSHARAIAAARMPNGLKVFLKFSCKFYPDVLLVGNPLSAEAHEKVIYDAAFRKGSDQNILALFCVGDAADGYTSLDSDQDIVDRLLGELDEMFDGEASRTYQKHVVQNWSLEPFIQGSYNYGFPGVKGAIRTLKQPVDRRIYFAGEALSFDNGATVPGAMESAYDAVERLLLG
jgi:monoamine oxidase